MQVVEVQGRSGLPHYHGMGWCRLTPAQRELLSSLQAGTSTLTMADLVPLVQLAAAAITVTTSPTILRHQFPLLTMGQAEEAVVLARRLQVHTCTPSCTTVFHLGQQCSERFPRLPSLLDLVARRPPLETEEEEARFARVEELQRQVQEQLRAREGEEEEEEPAALLGVLRQLGPAPQVLPQGSYWWQGIAFPPCQELDTLLLRLGALAATEADTVLLALYHSTLLLRHQPRFLPRRRVCEATMASYNPWIILATNSNHEVDLLAATPGKVVTYMAKGSRQESLARAVEELRRRGRVEDVAAARRLDSAIRAGHREVTATEACFRLDSRLPFTSSTWGKVVRVSCHLGEGGRVTVTADKQRYTLRPHTLDHLCLAQFLACYALYADRVDAVPQQGGALTPLAVPQDTDLPPSHLTHLPATLTLQDGQVLRRVRRPRVVDWAPATTYATIVMFKASL